jgi:hypothetical protein
MLGPIILFIAAFTGTLSIPISIIFLLFYGVFVITVVIGDKIIQHREKKKENAIHMKLLEDANTNTLPGDSIEMEEAQNFLITEDIGENAKINKSRRGTSKDMDDKEETSMILDDSGKIDKNLNEDHFSQPDDTTEDDDNHFLQQKSEFKLSIDRTKHRLVWSMVKMKRFLHKSVKSEDLWQEMNMFQKVVYLVIDLPFDFIRRMTIPPGSSDAWDRRFACVTPVLSVVCFFLATGMIDFTGPPPFYFWILLGIGLILSIIIWFTTKQQHAPRRFILIYALFAFIMSIVWIYWAANVLVDVLNLFWSHVWNQTNILRPNCTRLGAIQ